MVSSNLSHAAEFHFGLHIWSNTCLFGASTETYNCVGSVSNFSITLGRVPFVTSIVVMP